MNKYTNKLKELINDFSYNDFIELLKEIDAEILNGNIDSLDDEFIYYFKRIINFVNDRYIVDEEPGTLGYKLLEDKLINKERLTPIIALTFFFEQKRKLGLDNVCNKVFFSDLNTPIRMSIRQNIHTKEMDFNINCYNYDEKQKSGIDIDKYNYNIMHDIIHELTHVYQQTRTEETENLFDKLAYYDSQVAWTLEKNGANISNYLLHQSMLIEFMADEQAEVFMLHLSKKHPEYFNDKLIEERKTYYKDRKMFFEYTTDPRKTFKELISDAKDFYESAGALSDIEPILKELKDLKYKSQPIIDELQKQGISEKGCDIYYNIFLNSYYTYNGEEIIMIDSIKEPAKKETSAEVVKNSLEDDITEKLDKINVEQYQKEDNKISMTAIEKRTKNADTKDKSIITRLFKKLRKLMKSKTNDR